MNGWELRIAVLWLINASLMSAAMLMAMFEPGILRDLMAGEVEGMDASSSGLQFLFAVSWLVPLTMAFLSLVLTGVVGRWVNGVVAAVFAAWWILDLVGHLGGTFGGESLLTLVGSLSLLLIVWHAWKWPQPREVSTPRGHEQGTLV